MEATPEQSAEGLVIVRVLAAVLDRLIYANAATSRNNPDSSSMMTVTKFHAMKPPGISIQLYLERIQRYASCSNECFILALIYIDRLIQRNNFLLSELNVHRVAITSVLLAAKFFDDAYYNNAYYAKVGGVLVHEMNGLEVDFLFRINFSLYASSEEFTKYRHELLSHSDMAVPSNSMINVTPFDNQNCVASDDVSPSPPPAQVSPEIHFSTTPNDIVTSNDQSGGMYIQQRPDTPPSSVSYSKDPNSMIIVVPPENETSVYNNPNEFYSEKRQSELSSYYGFPLHPQPTFYPQQQPHIRRNSMPHETIPSSSTIIPDGNISNMPLSDPIRSIQSRYNTATNYVQPIHCMPQFPKYHHHHNNNSHIDTASTSSVVTMISESTLQSNNHNATSSSSSSSSYYSGKVIVMDQDQRIQQPLHLWDGTPITVVHHHHHGTSTIKGNVHNNTNTPTAAATTTTTTTTNTTNACYHNNVSNHQYHYHHPSQHSQQQQQVHIVAISGVGGR